MTTWIVPVGDELVTYDSDTMTATVGGVTRPLTDSERTMVETSVANKATAASNAVAQVAQDAAIAAANTLATTATVLLQDFIAHAQQPVANRSQVTAASLDARAGTLMAQALPSTDPRIIGLTAKITALGLRLTRERDDYEAGLL
jgi:hypothetical protein